MSRCHARRVPSYDSIHGDATRRRVFWLGHAKLLPRVLFLLFPRLCRMFSQHPLHNPAIVLPPGPRTPSQVSHSINPLTSNRAAHITRLYSILQHLLSLPPSLANSTRLLRAWRALASCKEVHLGVLWRVGTAVLEHYRTTNSNDDDEEAFEARSQRKSDWLKSVQEGKFEKVVKFNEYILSLCALGGTESMRFALEELES